MSPQTGGSKRGKTSRGGAGDLDGNDEPQQPQREKVPRRIIHFSSGRRPWRSTVLSLQSKLTWGPYFWFHMWRAATSTISACDYLGERMASSSGSRRPKYQYAIDEYYRMKKEVDLTK
uniref:Uncharacterized protein n=1 Tax=Takifugu rubripes TaxID=31033 RepID=A0A674NNF2_TAKRU